jgi:iron complex outermembrane receptor protein
VLYCDVALFHLRTDNDFGRYRIPGRPLETFYRNVGSSRRYGLEAFLDWTPHRRLGIKLAYTYSDFKYISYEIEDETLSGTRLPNSPAHYAYLDVETHLRRNVTAGVGIRLQSRSYIDATNLTWIDGFALVNVRLIYGFEAWRNRLELHLAGRNIFSAKYIAFTEPDPDGNSYQPGPTAEFVVGLRVYLGRTRSY